MKMKKYIFALVVVLVLAAATQAELFKEDFEGDLSAWVGKNSSTHHGEIVTDPLDSNNNVLHFTKLRGAGDIFTATGFDLVSGQQYTISFRYLGYPSQSGDTGGYAGFSSDLSPSDCNDHIWYYGTGTESSAADVLVDDSAWHSYSYMFTAPLSIGNHIYLMFEDFIGSDSIAGNAYFDDISLVQTPIPGAVILGILGLGVAGWKLRVRKDVSC
jgi:hypothetical protein